MFYETQPPSPFANYSSKHLLMLIFHVMLDENMLSNKTKLEKYYSIYRDSINSEKVSLYLGNNVTATISLFKAPSNLDHLIPCNNLYHEISYLISQSIIMLFHMHFLSYEILLNLNYLQTHKHYCGITIFYLMIGEVLKHTLS